MLLKPFECWNWGKGIFKQSLAWFVFLAFGHKRSGVVAVITDYLRSPTHMSPCFTFSTCFLGNIQTLPFTLYSWHLSVLLNLNHSNCRGPHWIKIVKSSDFGLCRVHNFQGLWLDHNIAWNHRGFPRINICIWAVLHFLNFLILLHFPVRSRTRNMTQGTSLVEELLG